MAKRCDVQMPDGTRCGRQEHCVVRPTIGGPGGALCYTHQRDMAKHVPLYRKGGWRYLVKAGGSRTYARIFRGG
jgi:hypothetical protein